MTSPKPDDTPIPLTDDLGDTRALLTPERDPITGARVAGAQQRAAKHVPTNVGRPIAPARRRRRPPWAVPVVVGVLALVGASVVVVATRDSDAPPVSTTASAPTTAAAAAAVSRAGPTGPLEGFDGTYRITIENVQISGAFGGFFTGPPERTGNTVTARYDGANGSGSATIDVPEGPATVTSAANRQTCTMQWAGDSPAMIDGKLGHPVLVRGDGSPLNTSECGLPIPSDGTITPKFGLVDERPQVQDFRVTTGTAVTSAGDCADAAVIRYDIIATRVR